MAQQTPTILVLDDEAPLLQTLVEALQGAGLHVLQAHNGKDGLDIALSKHPDLILSDNLMPVMSGIDMVTHLRQDDWGKRVPVIVMTNFYSPETVNTTLQSGTDYIMKNDLGIDRIVEMVQQRLGRNG